MKSYQMFNKMLDGPTKTSWLMKSLLLIALLLTMPVSQSWANENSTSLQETKEITGTVIDAEGYPIVGATIIIKGTTAGTITDADGNFSMEVPTDAEAIEVSFIGMLTEELLVGNETNFSVTLIEDLINLDELVVIGYGSVKKSDVTGAIAKVSGDDLSISTTGRVDQALQGKAAGVQVGNISSRPGGDVMIRVRGTGSINSSDPVVVVDGVLGGDLKNLNMNDVESIEVLKDASAQAIYGANAANGVILVTTKKGVAGKLTVNVDYSYGTAKKWNDLELANNVEWMEHYNLAVENDDAGTAFDSIQMDTMPNVDWRNVPFQTGSSSNLNVSVSGGSEDGNFYLSFSDLSQKGIIKLNEYMRRTARININRTLYDYENFGIEVGANLSYTYSEQRGSDGWAGNFGSGRPAMSGYAMDPVTPVYLPDDSTYNTSSYNSHPNPLSRIMFQTNDEPDKEQWIRAIPYLSIDFLKDFNFRATYDVGMRLTDNSQLYPTWVADSRLREEENKWEQIQRKNERQQGQFILNYEKEINNHSFGLTGVYEIKSNKSNYMKSERFQIPTDIYFRPSYSSGTDIPVWDSTGGTIVVKEMVKTEATSSLNNEHNLNGISYLARLRYGYNNRYLFTGSFRRDATGKFGENSIAGNFWSWSLAWNIHNEAFFNVDFINQLKLRGGWGQVGNSDLPSNRQFHLMDGDIDKGFTKKWKGNPNLMWETATSYNIAMDMAMWRNQLMFTVDVFRKLTENMLVNPDPSYVDEGYTEAQWVNLGEMQNEGIELSADYRGRIGDFSFSVGGNITFLRNEVLKLSDEEGFFYVGTDIKEIGGAPIHRTEAGHPLSGFYGYEVIGIFETQEDIDTYPAYNGGVGDGVIGTYIYRNNDVSDSTNAAIIDANDRTWIGSPHPDFIYAINLTADYKGIDFTAFFQGVHGNDIYSIIPYITEDGVNYNQTKDAIANAWHPEINPNGTRHMATFNNDLNQKPSTAWVYDGSYFRLKTLQLGYTFPAAWTQKAYIQKFRIYFSAENLFTISSYNDVGFDPEITIDPNEAADWKKADGGQRYLGVDSGLYPMARTFTFGVNLTF